MISRKLADRLAQGVFFAAAVLAVLVLCGIFLLLFGNGVQMFREVSPLKFFGSTVWNPDAYAIEQSSYGILGMLWSTLMTTIGAMVIAVPLGIATAAYLSEVAPPALHRVLRPLVELLAAVPSVAVGFFGIVVLGPAIAWAFGLNNGFNALNGAVLLAFMSLPTIISVAEDALRAVPQTYREASMALGARRWTTIVRVTLPAARPGLIAASMLGMGRAIGETMTVLMATGNATAFPLGPFDSVRTMTATIAIELGEVSRGTAHYYSLFAIGAVLFAISLVANLIAERFAAKYRHR